MAGRVLVRQGSDGTCDFAAWSLITADIIYSVLCALNYVEFGADAVFFEVSATSSLEFGNFVPNPIIAFSGEVC